MTARFTHRRQVFDEAGRVAGVATAVLRRASNIGYIAPMALVRLFLDAYEKQGAFPGIGAHFVEVLWKI